MPLRTYLPLPGPFVWVSGHRRPRPPRSRFAHLSYWLLGGWALEATFWVTVFVVWFSVLVAWWLLKITAMVLIVILDDGVRWTINRLQPRGRHARTNRPSATATARQSAD